MYNLMKKYLTFKPVYYAFALALLLRIVLPILDYQTNHNFEFSNMGDTPLYEAAARALVYSHEFNDEHGKPVILRTPGYPIFMIPGVLLGHIEAVTIFLQVILSCATVVMIYKISLELFQNEIAAFISVLLAGFDRVLIQHASLLLTETLFTFLLTLFLYFIILYLKHKALRYIFISSILLTMAVYVRPVGYYLPVVFIIGMSIWLFFRHELNKKIMIHFVIFFIFIFSLVSIWQIRNHIAAQYSGFASVSEHDMYFHYAYMVLAVKEGIDFKERQYKLGDVDDIDVKIKRYLDRDKQPFINNDQAYNYIRNKGLKIILDNPLLFIEIHLMEIFDVLKDRWFPYYLDWADNNDKRSVFFSGITSGITGIFLDNGIKNTINILSKEDPFILIIYIFFYIGVFIYYLSVFVPLFSKEIKNKDGVFFLTITGIYFSFFVAGMWWGGFRFRHPMIPSMSVLGGMGILIVYNKLRMMFETKLPIV